MRAAIYARVSTSHLGQDPDVQLRELRRYCEARGWTLHEEVVDHGFSGGTDQRPGLKRLLELARGREIDSIVVLKLDRLGRSLKHLVTLLDEFQDLGVVFVAVKDAIDWSTASGRLFASVLGALAEFERAMIRERVVLGIENARAKGKTLGRPRKRNDEEIRKLRAEGLSYRAIERKLGLGAGAVYRTLHEGEAKPHERRSKLLSTKSSKTKRGGANGRSK